MFTSYLLIVPAPEPMTPGLLYFQPPLFTSKIPYPGSRSFPATHFPTTLALLSLASSPCTDNSSKSNLHTEHQQISYCFSYSSYCHAPTTSLHNVLNNASTKRPTNPTSTHTRTLDSGLKPRSSTSGPQRGIAAPMRCLRPSLSVSFDLSLSPVASRQLTPNYLCFPKRSPSQNQRVIPTSVSLYSSMHRH